MDIVTNTASIPCVSQKLILIIVREQAQFIVLKFGRNAKYIFSLEGYRENENPGIEEEKERSTLYLI
ncbi:hypothetical protein CVS40_5328 [Lucilia cuprina]|nr:hypothetical protein CVS40_5328 [Lucilia cuprina]